MTRMLLQPTADVCTLEPICAPAGGSEWTQDSGFASVIWNPANMTPFDRYEKVDVYLVDDANKWQMMLQAETDLNIGMLAKRKDTTMFPVNLPVNRTCKIVFTSLGQPLDGTHRTLNSSDFFLIRTQQVVTGTSSLPISTTITLTPTVSTPASIPTHTTPASPDDGIAPEVPSVQEPLPPTPGNSSNHTSLSAVAIGLIAGGSVALLIAAVAVAQVLRTRRRYMRNNANFKTLPEPNSPMNGSVVKGSGIDGSGGDTSSFGSDGHGLETKSGVGAAAAAGGITSFGIGAGLAPGRNSTNTIRSNTAMLQGAHALSGYNNPEPIPTIVVPLVERRPSTLDPSRPTSSTSLIEHSSPEEHGRYGGNGSRSYASLGGTGGGTGRPSLEPVISAGDARLIADTFRKSLRRPRWEEAGVEDDDEEQDEARRAANELLRKELNEQGLDVQKTGVQRRVTIQTRPTGPEPDAAL
ncbi:hypothetical protein BGW41_007989 [Actinomortierella wolfii]|nr:hypothetical protein BGW41_007989 [Actinomortierella wolfii]